MTKIHFLSSFQLQLLTDLGNYRRLLLLHLASEDIGLHQSPWQTHSCVWPQYCLLSGLYLFGNFFFVFHIFLVFLQGLGLGVTYWRLFHHTTTCFFSLVWEVENKNSIFNNATYQVMAKANKKQYCISHLIQRKLYYACAAPPIITHQPNTQ